VLPKSRRDTAHLVTEARKPRSEDIADRERRYLIMMAFRVACFVLTIVLFAYEPKLPERYSGPGQGAPDGPSVPGQPGDGGVPGPGQE